MLKTATTAFLLALLPACGGSKGAVQPTPPTHSEEEVQGKGASQTASPLAAQAKAGVDNPELQSLLVDAWDRAMRQSPVYATTMGDHRFDDKLGDNSERAQLEHRQELRETLHRAQALDTASYSERDRITLSLFVEELERDIDREVCENFRWSVSPRSNPIGEANTLPEDHKVEDLASARHLLARYTQIPQMVDNEIANLRSGLAQGRVANAETLRRTVAMVKGQIDAPMSEWVLLKPAAAIEALGDGTPEERAALANQLRALVDSEIKPAFARYQQLLQDELLAKGREGATIGVHALPDGLACYEASIRGHINLAKSADEIHALGLAEIARINKEMGVLGAKLFKAKSLAATLKHLRTDTSLYFSTADEIIAKAEATLAKAKATIPGFFGILPQTDCRVVAIPDYEAPYTTIAYYKQPHADGEKPGEYFINTYKPETRPRYEMEVLAYHESIPGHHLQIAISQERQDLPLFRRHGGSTAFVEGWALYTERLSDEMGMYSGDLDRMGMLSYDAWRASRLVVDTGIHAKGWTREQAETFMREHTALTFGNIANEVDRYISWPGQAVAYKVGQLEILRLRAHAKEELGDSFDLKAFHDAVLRQGAVTLPVLAQQVQQWIDSVKGEGSGS